MLKKLQLSLIFALLFSVTAFAQSGTITGTITDAETGEPLLGAYVFIESLQKGAGVNLDGEYTLSNVPTGTYTLTANFIGYKTFSSEVEVGTGTVTLDIAMEVDLIGLDEVVVTGFGTIDRQAFTGTVSSVSSESLESVPVASVDQALQGKASGVVITSSTGTPGATQDIRIRGLSSVNAGVSPLFVIDGVPVVNGNFSGSGATSSLGVLANLNSSDIESITILKDAASTAPYGARGTNGVVVITTKSGKAGNTTYSFSAQRGYNNQAVDGKEPASAALWDELYVEAVNNLYGAGTVTSSPWDGETDTDWGDITRRDDAVQQEYTLSARGGNEVTNFYASAGFFDQDGFVIGSSLNRFSGKFDISHQLDDRVKLQNSFTGSWVEQDGILEGAGYFGSPILAKFFIPSIYTPFAEDGSLLTDEFGTFLYNPLYTQQNDIDRKRNSRVTNNTKLDVKLMDNLTLTSRFAVDVILTEEKFYNNRNYGDGDDVGGDVWETNRRNFNYVWQNTLGYVWVPDVDHSFNFKAISETQRNYQRYLWGDGQGFAADGLYNIASTGGERDASGSTSDWAVQSFTGLVNYGYQNKLFFDGSVRYEGNSRFGQDDRWGTFWSVGVGYVLTEEDYLADLDWLNFLKVRASYGLTGNASVGINQYQATVDFGSYNLQPDIQTDNLGNNTLTWEKANSLDIGVEFEVFDKVSGGVTFFRKDSYDLLFNVPLSRTTGHNAQEQNIGELYNQGIEAELNVDVIRNRDFKWNIGANLSTLKNEITKLPVDGNGEVIEITGTTQYRASLGLPVRAWYMREWAGVDPANGDPLWYMDDGNGGRTTTNSYNSADLYYQNANPLPTLFGGINTRIDVKNFYVSTNLYYSFGNKVYDSWAFYMKSDGQFYTAFGYYQEQEDRWQQPGDIAKNPKPILGGNQNSNSNSSRRLYDGDYLRLKTLNLGYNVPAKYLQNIGLKSASVYFLGQNLWTYAFDDDLGFDPEVDAAGYLNLNAPPLQSVTFGVKVNF